MCSVENPATVLSTPGVGGKISNEYGGDLEMNSENDTGDRTFLLEDGKSHTIFESIKALGSSSSRGEFLNPLVQPV